MVSTGRYGLRKRCARQAGCQRHTPTRLLATTQLCRFLVFVDCYLYQGRVPYYLARDRSPREFERSSDAHFFGTTIRRQHTLASPRRLAGGCSNAAGTRVAQGPANQPAKHYSPQKRKFLSGLPSCTLLLYFGHRVYWSRLSKHRRCSTASGVHSACSALPAAGYRNARWGQSCRASRAARKHGAGCCPACV